MNKYAEFLFEAAKGTAAGVATAYVAEKVGQMAYENEMVSTWGGLAGVKVATSLAIGLGVKTMGSKDLGLSAAVGGASVHGSWYLFNIAMKDEAERPPLPPRKKSGDAAQGMWSPGMNALQPSPQAAALWAFNANRNAQQGMIIENQQGIFAPQAAQGFFAPGWQQNIIEPTRFARRGGYGR